MNIRARFLSALLLATAAVVSGCDSAEERAQAHFERGVELLEAGDPDKAQLEFRNAVKLQPELYQARFHLGEYLKSINNIRGAVGQFRSVVELQPGHVGARTQLAEIMLIAGQLEEAQRHVEAAFEREPQSLHVRAVKASVDYKLGDKDAAVAMARGILADEPGNTTARLVTVAYELDSERLDGALAEADAGLAHDPENLSLNVVRLGVLEKQRDVDALGAQLQSMVKLYPETDRFREALARWYVFRKDHDGAEEQYRGIAANNPDDPQKALDVVRFLNAVHGAERAREELERLLSETDPPVEYELAIALLDVQEGDEAAAIARLDASIAARGDTAGGGKAKLERAKIHIEHEEWAEADALLDAVVKSDPKNQQALLLRASRFLASDEPDLAIRELRTALDVAPDDVQVMLMLASAYERNGNGDLALERLGQAVQVSDYDVQVTLRYAQALLSNDKIDVAESLIFDGIKKRGDEREFLVALAQIKLRKEEWREATVIAERLQEADPDDETAKRIVAASLLGQARYEEGAEVLRELASRPGDDDPANMASYVRARISAGDVEEAEAFLEQRLVDRPDDVLALTLRASISSSKGDLAAAEADLKRAIELEPGNAAAYAALARIYNSQGKQEEVARTLARGLERDADNVALRVTQAMQLEHEGRFDEAIDAYAEVYRANPNSTVLANNLASLLAEHRRDDPEQIERAYNIAKRFRDSDQPYLQDTYGWLLYLTGDAEGALPYLESAADALKTNPYVQYHAGVALTEAGRLDQARELLRRSLELGEQVSFSQEQRAQEALARIDALEAAGDGGGEATTQ